ncbi:MAG: chromosomal replication initiator protein DnaA [Anaerolineales bacterium]|nr:chromosomal replication initiator protein DnaA [Anaerolineales bacterium]
MSPESAWKATLGELELQMTKATFNTWLRDARLISADAGGYVVGVRNAYAKDWLQNRLKETILRTLNAIVTEPVDLSFVVWSEHNGAASPSPNGDASGPSTTNGHKHSFSSRPAAGNPLLDEDGLRNNGYRFSTFIVGPSNRLAHAAALSVGENPGQTYNPLFIYGGVGLGKTHLLHAVGHKCRDSGYRVLYTSSETFTNDLIQSIRSRDMAQFREKYRSLDVLLIDDIQFIAGKESTQEELFHTFNELHSNGKQVVLSSDRPPKAMVTLEERLQSRFEWGLMADIQQPDVETRMAILEAKLEHSQVYVPRHVLETIARNVRNNIRELEGALNKVIAYAELNGGSVDDQLVTMALADLLHYTEKVTVSQVLAAVANHYRITLDALTGSSRSRAVAFPRQMAMYLARTETDASFPQIGGYLGNRDHTTVLYGYEKIAGIIETDANVRRDVLKIKSSLYETVPA